MISETDELFSKYIQKASEKEEKLKIFHKTYVKEKVAIFSNLALIYSKKENFELGVEHDLKVISKFKIFRLLQDWIIILIRVI